MDSETLQLGLAQLAALVFSSGALIAQPQLALAVAFFMGLILAFSLATSLIISLRYNNREGDTLSSIHAARLGTHLGGMLCYVIMIYEAFARIA